jgi:hypothetical protein
MFIPLEASGALCGRPLIAYLGGLAPAPLSIFFLNGSIQPSFIFFIKWS